MKKENETIKDRIIRDIGNLLEQEKEDYYKPVRADRNKTLSTKEYLNNIKP